MVSMYLLIPLSLMLFVVGIWAVRYAVKSNQFDDLDNAAQRVILDDRQERRQALADTKPARKIASTDREAASLDDADSSSDDSGSADSSGGSDSSGDSGD